MQPLFLPPPAITVSKELYSNNNNYTAKYTITKLANHDPIHFSRCTSLMDNETDIGYESQQSSKSNQSLNSAVDPYTYSQMLYQMQYDTTTALPNNNANYSNFYDVIEPRDIGCESQQLSESNLSSLSNQSLGSPIDPHTYSQMLYQREYQKLKLQLLFHQQMKKIATNELKSNVAYQTSFSAIRVVKETYCNCCECCPNIPGRNDITLH